MRTLYRISRLITLFTIVSTICLADAAFALRTNRIASGLSRPVFVCSPPGDSTRLFIVEQWTAQIKIKNLNTNSMNAVPFADLNSRVIGTGNERGLLGMAWDPEWPDSNYFYVHYDNNSGNSVISRFRVRDDNPDLADSTSEEIIITIIQPSGASFQNHKGGMIEFGPNDGYLYIGMGDGGSGGDPGNRAQSDTTRLGKMLRLNVRTLPYTIPPDNPWATDTNFVKREFWAKGLRNPWRWSHDRLTGDLYIGDVGQNDWEEVDYEPDSSPGGRNYGWRCMEGTHCTGSSGCTCNDPSLTLPVEEYGHGPACSITGGYVYRGCKIDSLYGRYLYADYCSDQIWSFRMVGGLLTDSMNITADLAPDSARNITGVVSFGLDAAGEMYICDHDGGEVFKILADTIIDCNSNGCADSLDILFGQSVDTNDNGVPDECDCFAEVMSEVVISPINGEAEPPIVRIGWIAEPAASELYRVYRALSADAAFPAEYSIIADNILPIAGGGQTSIVDSLESAPEFSVYVVTSVCP